MRLPINRMAPLWINIWILAWWSVGVFASSSPPSVYPVDEHIFNAVVDHYNFRPTKDPTFPLRFYVNEQHWNGTGPCFFYAGNEANIFQFVNNSGFLFESAIEFGAIVAFAEHRYYGKSNPWDDVSFLTVEQAMADFNTLNVHIRKKWRMAPETAFIVFGGSYGGNLAMWLRLKNPNLWSGAVASSATPLKHLLRESNGFAAIYTQAYGNVSSVCPDLVRSGWKELFDGAKTSQGRISVAQALGLCQPLPESGFADDIHGWVGGALETMVQYGYPYPTEFYNPVPAFPFKVACEGMLAAGTGLGALRAAVQVYYNYTGQAGTCFSFEEVLVGAASHWKRKGENDHLHAQEMRSIQRQKQHRFSEKPHLLVQGRVDAWGYQTCTEVYQPMPTNGKTDFEIPYTPNKTAYFEHCQRKWGVQPRPNWEEMHFMGANIAAGSNIFLSNGQLDPWREAGIQEKPKGAPDSIVIRIIEHGAHHLDLRASNDLDPPSVVAVRIEEKAAMRKWIKEWHAIYSKGK